MESYIVRIYRRSETVPHSLIGVVEDVEERQKKPFTTVEELWQILTPKRREPATPKKRTPRTKT